MSAPNTTQFIIVFCIFFVLTVINFQNIKSATWWLSVHKIHLADATCKTQKMRFYYRKVFSLFI